MEITTNAMYWIVIIDNLKSSLSAIFLICFLFLALGFPMLTMMDIEELFPSIAKRVLVVAVTLLLALTFIPDTKQMAAIMIMPKIANSEKVQTVGNKIYDFAVEWMEELKPNKKESEWK